jgi:hypothetical protein
VIKDAEAEPDAVRAEDRCIKEGRRGVQQRGQDCAREIAHPRKGTATQQQQGHLVGEVRVEELPEKDVLLSGLDSRPLGDLLEDTRRGGVKHHGAQMWEHAHVVVGVWAVDHGRNACEPKALEHLRRGLEAVKDLGFGRFQTDVAPILTEELPEPGVRGRAVFGGANEAEVVHDGLGAGVPLDGLLEEVVNGEREEQGGEDIALADPGGRVDDSRGNSTPTDKQKRGASVEDLGEPPDRGRLGRVEEPLKNPQPGPRIERVLEVDCEKDVARVGGQLRVEEVDRCLRPAGPTDA